ncbi:MAG: S-methyl-5'-thioinosine phosphorylase [Wenzhouxiangella sp.]
MTLGIIGGTGALDLLEPGETRVIDTPFGPPSSVLTRYRVGETSGWFLARHGQPHAVPPHRVNYRANIDALRQAGVSGIVAINAVGGIDPALPAGALVVPDQLIDYTWGRTQSFSDSADDELLHIEFADPFAGPTRDQLIAAADRAGVPLFPGGCIAVTQGPRLETAAEIRRLAADGNTLVGMTTMPEAALAREAGIDYASLCVVANLAAGLSDDPITMEDIASTLSQAMRQVRQVLEKMDL